MTPLTYFVRHGQTDWNAEYRLQGRADIALNALGHKQAMRNGKRLSGLLNDPTEFDFVASPLRRTQQTMERIRAALDLPGEGYRIDPLVIEIHFGDWEGFTFAELESRSSGSTGARLFDKWGFVPPGSGAESYRMLLERVRPWLEALNRPTVCVTHGGVIRTLFRMIEDLPESEAATLEIHQDRVLKLENARLKWL